MFDQLKMLKQAHDLQKKLANEFIDTDYKDIKIVMNGKQEIIELSINDETLLNNKNQLELTLKEAFNKATSNAQMTMAQKMRADMGGMFGL
jgi:DNA-binding protein YbaB